MVRIGLRRPIRNPQGGRAAGRLGPRENWGEGGEENVAAQGAGELRKQHVGSGLGGRLGVLSRGPRPKVGW